MPLLQQAMEREPGIPIAYMQLGISLHLAEEYEQAVPVLQKRAKRSDSMMAHYQLGFRCRKSGDWTGAVATF